MSESALEAPRVVRSATAGNKLAHGSASFSRGRVVRAGTWWAVGAALVAASAGIVAWARTDPSYDAFGWLVWGFQTLHGTLDLGGAPSWKPLPFVFTVPYAIFPMAVEQWLWQVTAVAVSLGGSIVAGRIAYRLTLSGSLEARGGRQGTGGAVSTASRTLRSGAWAAAVFAGMALLGTEDYMHYILSVQSDPMIVTFTLTAVDSHLSGRPRQAVVFGVLAALGRPEAWPFLALYGLWCWFRVPRSRPLLIAGAAIVLFMWFGIPWITNGRPFVSAQLALNSPRELKQNRILGTLGRFHELSYWPVWVAAAVGVLWAGMRRDRRVLAIAAIALGWVIVEVAFALHGWPALPRYMFEAGGLAAVMAGVGVGWVLTELSGLRGGVPRWAGVALVVALCAALVPGALARVRTERRDIKHERGRATQITLLGAAVEQLGGWAHIRHCAKPTADVEWVSALAFTVHADVGVLGRLPHVEIRGRHPILWFAALHRGGWRIVPYHLHHHNVASCRSLRSLYVIAPGHPGGQLLRF